MEIFKNIEGYEGMYQVSNLGRVKSLSRIISTGNGYYRSKDKILKLNTNRWGYVIITLSKNGIIKSYSLHRLVLVSFLGEKDGYVINHKDGNKKNNNLHNLEYCTTKENVRHAIDTGLASYAHGEKSGFAKFKDSQVYKIREKYKTGERLIKSIAEEYNVSATCISQIVNNKSWTHLLESK